MISRGLRAGLAIAFALSFVWASPVPARAADPPAGAAWYETYIDTPDGQRLHTDVLRPKGYDEHDKTPIVLIVSPYLGMTSPTEEPGPSNRFYDFIEGAKVFDRGYSVVMVSLRGTGGSSGCLDILGPGEQTDVETAVEWSATQPWSTGRVGMYGKSYDANTGVVGAALQPKGLAAVVAQQIVPDRYRGSYSERVRYLQSFAYPSASYGAGGEGNFSTESDEEYIVNSVSNSADCQAGLVGHYDENPDSEFWRVRDFVEKAKGSTVPTFMTVGYLDANTNPGGGAVDFFNALAGPKRMWIGWWDHVRGNDKVGNRLAMGRAGFFDEVMRFYDHYVKQVPRSNAPTHEDPVVAAQTSDGTWRSETQWPPRDAKDLAAPLLPGTYTDDARNLGSRDLAAGPGGLGWNGGPFTTGHGSWTFSPALRYDAHLVGTPRAKLEVGSAVPRANIAVNVYDVAPDGSATMITRGAALLESAGRREVVMYPTDWIFSRGHRIGVLVSGANAEAYMHFPTFAEVTLDGGTVHLPFLVQRRTKSIQGEPAPRLQAWLDAAPFKVDEAVIADRTNDDFRLPPRQRN